MKKAQIGQIFVYLISILIIILVLYFGYRAISGIGKAAENTALTKFEKTLAGDIKTDLPYGSIHIRSYAVPLKYKELCFLDLPKADKIKNSVSIGDYPLMKDSIESNAQNNVFLFPEGDAFYAGSISVSNYPYFKCFEIKNGNVKIRLNGLGDSTEISTEPVSKVSVELDGGKTRQDISLVSTDEIIQLVVPAGTEISPAVNYLSVEIVSKMAEQQLSEAYVFEPNGTWFNPSAKLIVKYSPALVGEKCPASLTFTYEGTDYSSVQINCQENSAVFEIGRI